MRGVDSSSTLGHGNGGLWFYHLAQRDGDLVTSFRDVFFGGERPFPQG